MASPECVGLDHDDTDDVNSMASAVMDDKHDAMQHLSGAISCQGKPVMRIDKFNRRYIQYVNF
jgi:hypothetical protein